MVTLFTETEPRTEAPSTSSILSEPPVSELPVADPPSAEPAGEFELVVGTRHMASLAFVAIVGLAVFSGVSYLAGKAAVTKEPPVVLQVSKSLPEPPQQSIGEQFNTYQSSLPLKSADEPLFSDPAAGKLYIQMAAVEKGVAVVFAEGLRSHSLPAFVAPGPSEKIFRVLIGPLADAAAYQKAKDAVDNIGLSTFARRYEK